MELLLPLLVLLLLVPMFLTARRQKREMQRVSAMQDALRVGDRVMTTSGLYGTIAGVEDTTLELEIAPGVVTTWMRMAIREVVQDDVDTAVEEVSDEQGFEPQDRHDGGMNLGKN